MYIAENKVVAAIFGSLLHIYQVFSMQQGRQIQQPSASD